MVQLSKRFVSNTRYFGLHCSSATHFIGFEVPADKKSKVAKFERLNGHFDQIREIEKN
jgi:hypothetical protein